MHLHYHPCPILAHPRTAPNETQLTHPTAYPRPTTHHYSIMPVDDSTSSSSSGSSYGDSELPRINLFGTGNVDLRTVAPLYGVASEEEPDYLDYDIKGRGTVERMFLYSGSSYLTGILTGGVWGGRVGWKTAPSPRFWLRLNSVMNGAGKLGSKWGNNTGVFALMYSPVSYTHLTLPTKRIV